MHSVNSAAVRVGWVALVLVLAAPLAAIDGVVEIDQTRAEAGGVTPGDEPGLPVSITLPGSYRLTSDLLVTDAAVPAQDRTAILIQAVDVTLDLNGFSILGKTACDGGSCSPLGIGRGISGVDSESVTLFNGSIEGMGGGGVQLGSRATVRRLRVLGNGGPGIEVGAASVVSDCVVTLNGGTGILADIGARVEGNIVAASADDGVRVGRAGVVVENLLGANGGDGIEVAGSGGAAVGNVTVANGAVGLRMAADTAYAHNQLVEGPGSFLVDGVETGQNVCSTGLCSH